MDAGYISDFEEVDDHRNGKIVIQLNGRINKTGVISPRYNVQLRDDKTYLSIRLDTAKAWPRLEVVRRPTADGASYFGPYPSATSARRRMPYGMR